jgi:protein-disulfide isomerase
VGWDTLKEAGHEIGSSAGLVRIVVYSDYQCSFCATAHTTLRAVHNEFRPNLSVRYRHLPLRRLHPYAEKASLAAECAGEQGRFLEFTDVLYGLQEEIGKRPWVTFAIKAGVRDSASFAACVNDERYKPRVLADEASASALQLTATPTIILEGKQLIGLMSPEELSRLVKQELAGRSPPP